MPNPIIAVTRLLQSAIGVSEYNKPFYVYFSRIFKQPCIARLIIPMLKHYNYSDTMGRLDLHYSALAGHMTTMSWTARKSSDIAG